jgi:hypothetical protein
VTDRGIRGEMWLHSGTIPPSEVYDVWVVLCAVFSVPLFGIRSDNSNFQGNIICLGSGLDLGMPGGYVAEDGRFTRIVVS